MTVQFVAAALRVRSTAGNAGYDARFSDGLNVLSAPNSWGKSTLVQSMLYALGLEGMLSASRRSPLGPAMTSAIDLPSGRGTVTESWVELTLGNGASFLRLRRYVVSADFGANLVQSWSAVREAQLQDAPRRDLFVREAHAATGDLGFHKVLADFLGWTLPDVPGYQGADLPLYLELLFPLFWVEQKSGWAGISPRVPTYLQIREPTRRAVEYVLGLQTLERLRQQLALRDEQQAIGVAWADEIGGLRDVLGGAGLRPFALDAAPVSSSALRRPMVEVYIDGSWHSAAEGIAITSGVLSRLEGEGVVTAGERQERARVELDEAESTVREIGGHVRRVEESLAFNRADLDALQSRLTSIDDDRRRLRDVRTVERLGGDIHSALLSEGVCPTCTQSVDPRDVATHRVQTLEETQRALTAEQVTLQDLVAATERRDLDARSRFGALEQQLSSARRRVRALRDELVGPSAAFSVAQVRQQLQLGDTIAAINDAVAATDATYEALSELATRLDDVRARLAGLGSSDLGADDANLVRDFSRRFTAQLVLYGLRSVRPDEVSISPTTLLPNVDGVELSFDLGLGISASDTIRTKWAYHLSLLQTAQVSPHGHEPGFLVLDEPRQQEIDRASLRAFVVELAQTRGQFLYATSEEPNQLASVLDGLTFNQLPAPGAHLLSPAAV